MSLRSPCLHLRPQHFPETSCLRKNGRSWPSGGAGEVVGPATHQKVAGKGLDVNFPGNRGSVSCYLAHLSRARPPLRDIAAAPAAAPVAETTIEMAEPPPDPVIEKAPEPARGILI